MENRDKNIKALRPDLNLVPTSGAFEQFQNDTLRPILKFQNNLILQICHHQFVKRKRKFFQLSHLEQLEYIDQQISRDKELKHLLFGIIIGQFTALEWIFFAENEKELKKRMTSLLIQRVQSQCSLLSSSSK